MITVTTTVMIIVMTTAVMMNAGRENGNGKETGDITTATVIKIMGGIIIKEHLSTSQDPVSDDGIFFYAKRQRNKPLRHEES